MSTSKFLTHLDNCEHQADDLMNGLRSGTLDITFPQRLAATKLILEMYLKIEDARKEASEPDNAGTAVRKYAAAFAQPYAGGGRASHSRRGSRASALDNSFDSSLDSDADN